MKAFVPFCIVLLIVCLPANHGSNQPLPKNDWKDVLEGKQPLPKDDWKDILGGKQPLPNDDWKDILGGKQPHSNGDDRKDNFGGKQPLPNDDWKDIFGGKQPLPKDDWKDFLGNHPLPNEDGWKVLINQPLPNNDWKDLLHDVFNGPNSGSGSGSGLDGNSGNGNRGQGNSKIEDLVNKIVTNVPGSSKSKTKWYCNQLNSTTISDLEQHLENETRLFIEATKNAKNAFYQYQDHFKDFSIRQQDLSTAQNTLLQLLNIDSDSLSVLAISDHLLSGAQGLCDQYNVSLTVLNSTIQSLTATLFQTCSQSYQNRISSFLNHSISLDNDFQYLNNKISELLSDLDTSQTVLKTLQNLYNQTLTNYNTQKGASLDKINHASTGILRNVEDVRRDFLLGNSNSGKIVVDFSNNLPQLHERIISSNASLHLEDIMSLDIVLEVDHTNLTDDEISEFEEQCKKIIRGLSVYDFQISGDNVIVIKIVTNKKRDGGTFGKLIQKWVATFNQSRKDDSSGFNTQNIDGSKFSGKATNDTNRWVSEIARGGDFTVKISEIHFNMDRISNSSKIFQSKIDSKYRNYVQWVDKIKQEINSFAAPILDDGKDEVEIASAVYQHLTAVINSTKTALVYQLDLISGRILDANLTVLQIELNLTQLIDQMNQTNNPDLLNTLRTQKQVLTSALVQGLKTLAILQSYYDDGHALLLDLDYQLSKAENETNECILRFQKKDFATIHEIRQSWRDEKDLIREQFRSSFESLLNCTVGQDSIDGLDDNQTTSLSLKWNFHFNLTSGETADSKIALLKIVIPNLVAVHALVSKDSIAVTINLSGSKRAVGDLTAQASITSSPPSSSPSSSTTNQPASSSMPIIIGCVVGAAVFLVVLIVIVVLVMKKSPGEKV